ncbi:MAG: stage III sporulation protein AE [Oscillospiraceae bacterium]|nr:stage III sporulation protein AE [Oscillospiraceae bacterium]
MKKLFAIILLVIILPTFSASANNIVVENDYERNEIVSLNLNNYIEENLNLYQDELLEALPDDAQEFMEEAKPLELTFTAVLSELWTLLKQEITKPLKMFMSLAGVILLCAVAETLRDSASGPKSGSSAVTAFEMAGVLAGAGIMSAVIAECVMRTTETLTAAGAFMLTFIPILAGIMAVMGQLVSANLFNGAVIAAAQIFSQVMVMALMPLSVSILGVSIAGAVSPDLKTERLAHMVKTFVVWTLGLLTTLFVGLLTIQSLVSGSTDSVAMRAVKFTISGGVPFIGGSISDALSVVNGSFTVVKSATGAFGMVAIAAVCLPSLLSVLVFRFTLTAAAAVGEMFGAARLGSLLKSGENILSIILAMISCFTLIMLVSVALMIRIGGA